MNKLEYVNKLLETDDLSNYINKIENDNSISPPNNLKDKILINCYNSITCNKQKTINYKKIAFLDIMKVACFALIITLCTELFMNATYASTKTNDVHLKNNDKIYELCDKVNNVMTEFSDFMLSSNLKGE